MGGHKLTRRQFSQAGMAAVAWSALSRSRIWGANDRIRLGFIGVGNRGGQLLDAFLVHKDMEVAALCDVFEPYLERAQQKLPARVPQEIDFRKVLDRQDVDAVVISTPDHWHAIQTIWACKAGKDVYVEKPLSITVVEGRKMVEAARKYNRVVQVGTHRRSSKLYAQLHELVKSGKIGKVTVCRAYRLSNMAPSGIGKAPPSDPPAGLHWDLWLGPRPERPFQETIAPYKFRWWDLYSSQMANWGVHYLDAMRWMIDQQAPTSVCAMGGRFAVDDDRTIPDTMEAVFQFPSGCLCIFGQYEASSVPAIAQGELELRGTLGAAYIGGRKFDIIPERGGQFQDPSPRMEPMTVQVPAGENDMTVDHARNFLDCIKSRALPNADVEIGHRSTTCSLIANISYAVAARLEWDAEKERFTNNEVANNFLHYEYRKPWSLD